MVQSNTYFEELKTRAILAADLVNIHATNKDVNRNRVNYGELIAWARVLNDMGHSSTIPVWEDDNGYLHIPKITIGDWSLDFHERHGDEAAIEVPVYSEESNEDGTHDIIGHRKEYVG